MGSFGLGEREEVGPAVGAGRKRRPRLLRWRGDFQLKCGDDRIFVLLTERGARTVACLIEGARARTVA